MLHNISFVITSTLAISVSFKIVKIFKTGLVVLNQLLLHSKSNPAADLGQLKRQKILKWFVRVYRIVLSAQTEDNQLLWK